MCVHWEWIRKKLLHTWGQVSSITTQLKRRSKSHYVVWEGDGFIVLLFSAFPTCFDDGAVASSSYECIISSCRLLRCMCTAMCRGLKNHPVPPLQFFLAFSSHFSLSHPPSVTTNLTEILDGISPSMTWKAHHMATRNRWLCLSRCQPHLVGTRVTWPKIPCMSQLQK